MKPLRFHWRLMYGGEREESIRETLREGAGVALPDIDAQAEFCRMAEECGSDSLLVNMHFGTPDPILLAMALGRRTERIRFMIAHRPGLMSPTLFAQQINTLSIFTGGRVNINLVSGQSAEELRYYGDFLDHDARYDRMEEFLSVCRPLWRGERSVTFKGMHYDVVEARLNTPFISPEGSEPEVFLSGSSAQARDLAARHGANWVRFADAPDQIASAVGEAGSAGCEVVLRLSLIVRPTREEARAFAASLVDPTVTAHRAEAERAFVAGSDARSIRSLYDEADAAWPTPTFWKGAVRLYGPTSVALVGSPQDVADGLLEYARLGVSQFILSGWPKVDAMLRFGRDVLPLVREAEQRSLAGTEAVHG